MSFRAPFLVVILLALFLPLSSSAAEPAPLATADASSEVLGCDAPAEAPGLFQNALEAAEPTGRACTYTCTPPFGCPDLVDTPPGICQNGCCNYEYQCEGSCVSDSDCGPQNSCWSGCCVSWNRS